MGRKVDATDPSSTETLRDRRRVAGGDGRDPDAVEVVGEERRDAALRLHKFGQSAHVIETGPRTLSQFGN